MHMTKKRMLGRSVALQCVFLLQACVQKQGARQPDGVDDPRSWSVLESGPLGVGHRSFDAEYEDPTGLLVTLPVDVWYPTEDDVGDASTYYDIVRDELAFSEASVAAPVHPADTRCWSFLMARCMAAPPRI